MDLKILFLMALTLNWSQIWLSGSSWSSQEKDLNENWRWSGIYWVSLDLKYQLIPSLRFDGSKKPWLRLVSKTIQIQVGKMLLSESPVGSDYHLELSVWRRKLSHMWVHWWLWSSISERYFVALHIRKTVLSFDFKLQLSRFKRLLKREFKPQLLP